MTKERYVQEAKAEQRIIFHVKRKHADDRVFTTADVNLVVFSHQGPLIGTVQISNCIIKRIFVDFGSLVNVVFKSAFGKMKLHRKYQSRARTNLRLQ